MVAYAAEAQPAKPTHGGTASMLTSDCEKKPLSPLAPFADRPILHRKPTAPRHMAHRTGHDRRQFRFPDPLEDMIAPDNMVRVVDAFADAIDLEKLGFVRVRAHKRGAPPYHPALLLKIYIYSHPAGLLAVQYPAATTIFALVGLGAGAVFPVLDDVAAFTAVATTNFCYHGAKSHCQLSISTTKPFHHQ